MKIQDLTNEQANHWAAKAQKWKKAHLAGNHNWPEYWVSGTDLMHKVEDYTPTTNPAQWGELIEKFEVWISNDNTDCDNQWIATTKETHICIDVDLAGYGPTPGRAVVNAVIASVFGEEVPDDS